MLIRNMYGYRVGKSSQSRIHRATKMVRELLQDVFANPEDKDYCHMDMFGHWVRYQ